MHSDLEKLNRIEDGLYRGPLIGVSNYNNYICCTFHWQYICKTDCQQSFGVGWGEEAKELAIRVQILKGRQKFIEII